MPAIAHISHPLTNITIRATVRDGKPVITGISFGVHGSAVVPRGAAFSDALRKWVDTVRRYLDTGRGSLDKLPLDTHGLSPFRQSVLRAAREIPPGATVSYAGLARMAGSPRAARAAASVMRHNPFALAVPCHRVVRSDGSVGGFMGKTRGGEVELKRRLLRLEKIN